MAPSSFSIGLIGFLKSTSGPSVEHKTKPMTPLQYKDVGFTSLVRDHEM